MRAVRAVDDEAVTGAAEAHDLVAGDRVTALRELDGDAFIATDDDLRQCSGGEGLFFRVVHQANEAVNDGGGQVLAEADGGIKGLPAFDAQFVLDLLPDGVGNGVERQVVALSQTFEYVAAEACGLVKAAVAQILANFGSGATGVDEVKPFGARAGVGRRDDLHHVAVVKLSGERTVLAVDATAVRVVAHVRVDLVREVDGGAASGQGDDLALRREGVESVGEEVDLDVLDELAAVLTCALNFHQALEPGGGAGLDVARVKVVLEHPLREDAVFGDLMHLLGADLEFDGSTVGADHGRVQALVTVELRNGDEVLEAAVDGLVESVQGAERKVAVVDRAHDDAEAVDVEGVRERLVVLAHLVVDAVDRLVAPDDACADALLGQEGLGFVENAFENGAAVVAH